MATLNLNILPIHRHNGQESAELPGLLAVVPPRKTARGRERDHFIAYLMLSGNTSLSPAELMKMTNDAAGLFYQSHGPLTSAMRKAADQINSKLLERNRSGPSQGEYALGLLVLAAIRENQCTLLLSGPTHAVWVSDGRSRHIHEPALSGKGLGAGQSLTAYLSQVELHPQDLLALCGTFPRDWEADLLNERPPASLDASYRKLTFTKGDLNAVLIQAQSGHGTITILRPDVNAARHGLRQPEPDPVADTAIGPQPMEHQNHEEQSEQNPSSLPVEPQNEEAVPNSQELITEERLDALADFAAHYVQPSAYAIPPQPESRVPPPKEETYPAASGTRGFPSSIPRANPVEQKAALEEVVVEEAPQESPVEPSSQPGRARQRRQRSDTHTAVTRQVAKVMVGGLQTGRRMNERVRGFFQKFLPRLLPGTDARQPYFLPNYALIFIAVVIPVAVVTVASMVYLRFGQSIQYDELYAQARNAQAQAISETDPTRQRDGWQRVLAYLNDADKYRATDESKQLRTEAQFQLDILMGINRLEFLPAFANGLGSATQISRMAASESDLYMLDAEGGNILHASFTNRTLDLDTTFNCQPGSYSGYQVGALIDLLALPKVNTLSASVLGIDASGNLLYCAAGQVPKAIPLPSLPNTNWSRITSFALDSGNLYVLDAQSRAVWVFVGKDSTFTDTPYFYFGNEIPGSIDSAIDLAVNSDDLYLLHADGHLSTCTFSRLSEVPTRCQDPAPRVDNYPAHRDIDVFQRAHFTQMAITSPPNSVILLLDSENQSVFRFSPRSFELQTQVTSHVGKANPFKHGSVRAMAVSPNYVLYLAIGDQVYFATNMP
ncbi:MAG TPA: hypothetical protein VMN99_11560 [Anaerolineales bacterium]|nr:hypothetical protein [Anaerolineales bacterium]